MQSSNLRALIYSFKGSDSVHRKNSTKARLPVQCFRRKFKKLLRPAIQQSSCRWKILRLLSKRCRMIKFRIYDIGLYFNFIGKGFSQV